MSTSVSPMDEDHHLARSPSPPPPVPMAVLMVVDGGSGDGDLNHVIRPPQPSPSPLGPHYYFPCPICAKNMCNKNSLNGRMKCHPKVEREAAVRSVRSQDNPEGRQAVTTAANATSRADAEPDLAEAAKGRDCKKSKIPDLNLPPPPDDNECGCLACWSYF